MSVFIGSGTAICTPFFDDGKFNPEVYEKLLKFQIKNGADAVISCGTTGEASTLSNDEQVEVVRTAVTTIKASERKIPVIAGAGGNDTRNIIELGTKLIQAGVDALLLVTPYYNKTSQKGLVENFSYLASKLDVPIILYNVPARTALNMLPKTVQELSKVENIVAIKESSSDIVQISEIIERCGDSIDLICGNDDHVVPVLSMGGKGVISAVANIAPQHMHDMIAKFFDGDIKGSAKMQHAINPLVRCIFSDVSPMPVKEGLNLMGLNVGPCRRPLTTISDSLKQELTAEMKRFGLL